MSRLSPAVWDARSGSGFMHSLLDHGIGLVEHEADTEGNGLRETSGDEEPDGDESIDVVEKDSDEDIGSDNPLVLALIVSVIRH
jgi:hypothetical protein